MVDKNVKLIEQAIGLLREGMDSTGTGTFHYHKMRDAIDVLKQIIEDSRYPILGLTRRLDLPALPRNETQTPTK